MPNPKLAPLPIRLLALCGLAAPAAYAQSTPALYDPEPPANSAYVRIVNAGKEGAADVTVDGKARRRHLGGGEAGEYMVLPAGKHKLALQPSQAGIELDVDAGRAMTVAFTTLRPDTKPIVFDDKTNANKLKATLAVYHLDTKAAPVDILSADGKIKVFENLAPGTTSQRSVNPITIELIAAKPGDKTAVAHAQLAMEAGAVYSILLLPGEGGKPVARVVQNKVERYTGK